MKVPLSWLHEFVDPGMPVDELVEFMGRNGLEVEEVHHPGAGTEGVLTARVERREPHPDADKLQLVRISTGSDEVDLVCGAHNFEVGDTVAWAGPGASIPGMALEAREIRGVVSNGMLCSAKELQLAESADGILLLPSDTPLGRPVTEFLPIGEPVIEVAVLSDRGDQQSVLGIARELAALTGRGLDVPHREWGASESDVDLTVDAASACSHFATWVVEDVTVGPSPWWLRQRLHQCGIRAINNVVDVTNFVMLELGQPLHAFDLDRLRGPSLTVRWAEEGEALTTLDDQQRTLEATDLLIADAGGPVSLAGVMGGAETEVGESTTRVLLEGAVWDPSTIRRTSRRLNLVSEASLRFERRVDPAGARRAVARAAELLVQLGGGTLGGVREVGTPSARQEPVRVDPARVRGLLGVEELDADTQAAHLQRLGCDVEREGGLLVVTPPSWRGDILRPADVAEEVAKLHGFERIPSRLPVVPQRGGLSATQLAERQVRATALAGGFDEVVTRPFVGEAALEGVVPDPDRVVLANPLAKDASGMRPTLVEGLLQVVRTNVGQGRPGVAVFELGRIFRRAGGPLDETLKHFGDAWRWEGPDGQSLPTQPRTLGLAAQGLRAGQRFLDEDDRWSVYDLLAVLDAVVQQLRPVGAETWDLERVPAEREGFHPGRSAALLLRGVEIGFVGQLHPRDADARDLPEPVVVAELLLDPLLEHLVHADPTDVVQARPLVKHPAMSLDVALVAPDDLAYADLERAVRAGAGALLDELWWFDEYRGEQVGEGHRSIGIRLRLQDPDRQLEVADGEAVIAAIEREAARIGAALRR